MPMSTLAAASIQNLLLRGTSLAAIIGYGVSSNVWLALYRTKLDKTSQPAGTGVTEVPNAGAYARQPITFDAATTTGGQPVSWNSAAVAFPDATADWGPAATPIVAIAVVSGGSSVDTGQIMWWQNICPRVIVSGSPGPYFPIRSIVIATCDLGDC